jgi:hypothetical protein
MAISKKLTLVACILGAALHVSAFAGENGSVYATVGTGGVGVGYATSVAKDWAIRGEFTGLPSQSFSGSVGDFGTTANLVAKVDWNTVNLLGDWYPTESSFRVTGGVLFNNSKVTITGSGTVDTVNATNINTEVKVSDGITPYLGIGYGTRPKDATGWGFNFDVGLAFNNPKFSMTATGPTEAQINTQKAKVEDALKNLKTLPVFGIGISYSF